MARIVTVYRTWNRPFRPVDMSHIRWLSISAALARAGHSVDMATDEPFPWWRRRGGIRVGPRLRRVPLRRVRWGDYDAVKTLFHRGFEILERSGGAQHPFVISKLGSVVGSADRAGVNFFGDVRREMYDTQKRIHRASRYVTVLNAAAGDLWAECFGREQEVLIVPGAAEREIPELGRDPYPVGNRLRCLFAGNVYLRQVQPEANSILIDKLNALGRLLSSRGGRLYMMGPGDVRNLDKRHVTYLGSVPYEQSWSYFHHAHVGIVLAGADWLHNNESSKIYHYLRVGLPVVTESGFPNQHLVEDAGLGFIVDNGDLVAMAAAVESACHRTWDRQAAIRFILDHHTWDVRAAVYDRLIRDQLTGTTHRETA